MRQRSLTIFLVPTKDLMINLIILLHDLTKGGQQEVHGVLEGNPRMTLFTPVVVCRDVTHPEVDGEEAEHVIVRSY